MQIYATLPFDHQKDYVSRKWFRIFLLSLYRCIDFFNSLGFVENHDQLRKGATSSNSEQLLQELKDLEWGFLLDDDDLDSIFSGDKATNGKVSIQDH
eukprot:UN26731